MTVCWGPDMKNRKQENGFTLLEMLLAVGVLAASLLLITRLFEDTARGALYEKNRVFFDSVMGASMDMVDTMSEFDTVYALLQTQPAGVMEIPLTNDPVNAGVNPFNISVQTGSAAQNIRPSTTFANTNFIETGPIGTRISVVMQALDDLGDPNDERSIGVFVVGLDPISERDLRAASSALGAGGGFISVVEERPGLCLPAGCTNTIRSIHNSWQVDASAMAGVRFGVQITGTPADTVNGGYLAAFRFISESEIAGDYLYRLPQLTRPELNTMNTDILMSGNNIVGVDNIVLDQDMTTTGDMSIYAKGSIFAAGRLSVEGGDLVVDGDAETGNLNVGSNYNDAGLNIPSRNQVTVENQFLATDVTANGNLIADTGVVTTSLLAPSIRSNDTTISTLDATAAPGVFAGQTDASNLNVTGIARTGLTTGSGGIAVDSGTTGVLEMIANGNAIVSGQTTASSANFNDVDIRLLEECLSGC